MATWAYIMAMQPFLVGLRQILGKNDFVMFLVDDGNLCVGHLKAIEALTYIFGEGPKYGYNVQTAKGSICLGSCGGNFGLAEFQKQELIVQFGFNEAIIHIHPNDYADGEEKVEATSKYGLKMLGAFVGSDEFVKANIMKHVESFETTVENLEKVENLQY